MSYSMRSVVYDGDYNNAYLFINDKQLDETWHHTHHTSTESGEVTSTGGRLITLVANAGDRIYVRATRVDYRYYNILYCAEFISKM